jgi:hypothetical protein
MRCDPTRDVEVVDQLLEERLAAEERLEMGQVSLAPTIFGRSESWV